MKIKLIMRIRIQIYGNTAMSQTSIKPAPLAPFFEVISIVNTPV